MQNLKLRAVSSFKSGLLLTGGVAVLLAAVIFKPFAIVNAGERGVMMRFGKVQDTILDEGFHPIIPIVTTVKSINVRVRESSFNSDAASKDLQRVTTEISLNWHIDPVKVNRVYQQIGDEDHIVTGIITPAVSEVLKAATAKKTAE